MSTSPESQALREHLVAMAGRFAANPDMGLEAMREMFDTLQHLQAEPTHVTYDEVTAGDRPALWARPLTASPDHVVLYTHAGGYIAHDMNTSRKLAGHLAKAAGANALIPDYRLAPEHPFPAAIEDAVSAYRHLLNAGYAPRHIAFAGESAGGNLAAATILRARELGLPLPAAYVGFSPWFDLLGELPSFDSGTDAFLVRPVSQLMAGMYLGEQDVQQPLANPRLADLNGFPPSYVTAGADESLVDAVTDFSDRAQAAQVDVTIEVAPGMQHAFQWMAGRAPEADQNITRVGDWLRIHLAS
ncbi:alpha/beta hydrolase [Streptomyces sp. NPDC001185]|uniref:alpha/beta hydrolase n=1 Tax=Streptomyces sp. NPDC001185 TaxID=3154380 RepID=UPI0033302F94